MRRPYYWHSTAASANNTFAACHFSGSRGCLSFNVIAMETLQ